MAVLCLGSLSQDGVLAILEPTLVIAASGAFTLAVSSSRIMPLKIKFFHSFYHLLCPEFLTMCLKIGYTWTSQCPKKADMIPALVELAVHQGKQTLIR